MWPSQRCLRSQELMLRPRIPLPVGTEALMWCSGNRRGSAVRQPEELDDATRHVPLSAADIALLNPNTRAWPVCRTSRAAALTKAIYRRVPILRKQGPAAEDPWGVRTAIMLHLSRDVALLR